MIELIAAAVTGAVVGGGVWLSCRWYGAMWKSKARSNEILADASLSQLNALRSNCFIPDERGVKVRYSEASVARRVKAETPKEVV